MFRRAAVPSSAPRALHALSAPASTAAQNQQPKNLQKGCCTNPCVPLNRQWSESRIARLPRQVQSGNFAYLLHRVAWVADMLVQHPFCKVCGCWFCAPVLAGAMRARSARSAEDGTAARRNTDRPFPQAISSGHSYPYPRRNRQHGTTRRTSPSGGGFCGAAE